MTAKYKQTEEKFISREEKLLMEGLQEVVLSKLTSDDRIEVISKCKISDRTLSRYLKGEIGNMNMGKQILTILRKRIIERQPLSAA